MTTPRAACNYNVLMKAKLIKIGNSRGIRIPKSILEQCRFSDNVELEAERDYLIIRAANRRRQGWEAACREMAAHGDDKLLDADTGSLTSWDKDEWQW